MLNKHVVILNLAENVGSLPIRRLYYSITQYFEQSSEKFRLIYYVRVWIKFIYLITNVFQ